MADEITIEVDASEAVKTLDEIKSAETRKAVLEAGGAAMRVELTRHFRKREQEPGDSSAWPKNGQAFPKKYFWAGTRGNSVEEAAGAPQISGDTVSVNINSPALAHKLSPNPPPIRPGAGRKFLAVPANARAAAWDGRPADFTGGGRLAFAYHRTASGRWAPALVSNTNYMRQVTKGARKGQLAAARAGQAATHGSGDVQFWLIRKAQTKHDPDALPKDDALAESARTVALGVLNRLNARAPE